MIDRNRGKLILGLALVLGPMNGTAMAQATTPLGGATTKLMKTGRSARIGELLLPGDPVPFVDRGFILQIEKRESLSPGVVNVAVFASDGRHVLDAAIWPEGATQVNLLQAVMSTEHAVVATGTAVTTDRSLIHFIARTDSNGKLAAVVKTNPFVNRCVCAAADGTVWSLGTELDKAERGEDHFLLRQFSFEKGPIFQTLPRSSFPGSVRPASMAEVSAFGGEDGSYLRCGGGRVALFINLTHELITVDVSTHQVHRYAVDMSAVGRSRVTGLAVLESGAIFAALSEGGNPKGLTGLFELVTNTDTLQARWCPVEGTVAVLEGDWGGTEGAFLRLWGTTGDDLLVERRGHQQPWTNFDFEKPVEITAATR